MAVHAAWRMTALIGSLASLGAADAQKPEALEAEWNQWREQREERLVTEESWTSLVGLHWLDTEKAQTIGSADGNDIVIANLPPRLGQIQRQADGWLFTPAADSVVTVADVPRNEAFVLTSDAVTSAAGQPAQKVRLGSVSFTVIDRGDRSALRVWDRTAPARRDFAGLDWFAWNPDWRVKGRWEAHTPARTVEIVDVTGFTQSMRNPGAIRWHRDGREYRLEALQTEDGEDLFLIFADRSNRSTTYGAGRYLSTPPPDGEGEVVVDFNYAYSPPCAFSPYATCPLPPPENRLDVAVSAGEKRYRAHN